MKIDSHHHFWHYDPVAYDWIDESMSVIRRDFLPEHLAAEIRAAGLDGVISVQARQSKEETAWLLDLARDQEFICGVVGWLPLISPDLKRDLEALADQPKLRALRHVVQGEPDGYLLREDFNAGIQTLTEFDLVYDILILERQLPEAIEFVDRHPSQIFVLDHIAKPLIKDGIIEPWREKIKELARRENVFCKVSGLVTEAHWPTWKEADLLPYFETVLGAFGPARMMFGSDWPVCLVAGSYQKWAETVREFAGKLTAAEQAQLFGETAEKVYL